MPDGENGGPGYQKHPGYSVDLVPSPKRVRVRVGDHTVADSEAALLVLETAHTPVYYFPESDLATDLMVANDHDSYCPFKGNASYWNLVVDGRTIENAVWGYKTPFDEVTGLVGYRAFYWNRVDSWWEEDEEIFVHPRDPRVRIDVIQSHRRVVVTAGGQDIADSDNGLFLYETGLPTRYYLPQSDVKMDQLETADLLTACPYKGEARHWRLRNHPELGEVAWQYAAPLGEVARIKNHVCFYNERVEKITVGGRDVPLVRTKWSLS